MEAYLESYISLHNELDTTPKKRAAIKFSETPERFLLEKSGVKIIDVDRPVYGLVDNMIKNEKKTLYEMRKQYRSLVYAYLYDMDTEPKIEMINEVLDAIEATNKRLVSLVAAKDKGETHVMLREPQVNKLSTNDMNPVKKVITAPVATPVATPTTIGKTAKDILKETLFTGDVSATDLKVFLFKTLKECAARPSAKNNAVSKDKIIEKMLENPNLKKRLPASYRSKSKEELCRLLFPGK